MIRSWKLFAALLIGMTLAATFYGGINIGADTAAKQLLDTALEQTPVDVKVQAGGSPFSYFSLNPDDWTRLRNEILTINDVNGAELRAQLSGYENSSSYYPSLVLHGIMDGSTVYEGATISGSSSLGVNETYVVVGSPISSSVTQGQHITVYVSPPSASGGAILNLTVAGSVTLSDRTQAILCQYCVSSRVVTSPSFYQNILLVSWEKTFVPLMPTLFCSPQPGTICTGSIPSIDVYLNRDSLINIFDIQSSLSNVDRVVARIQNIASLEGLTAYSQVSEILQVAALPSLILRVFYVIVSLPVFFIAWYMGGTVFQSSLNLRRREIGLLLVRGATKGQLSRIFLGEALVVGILGGVIGLTLAALLNPVFVEAFGGKLAGNVFLGGRLGEGIFLSRDTAMATVVFTTILTLLAVWRPARRAAGFKPLDALKEYVYVEETKAYKQTKPMLAFGLGLYKVVFLLLGINFLTLSQSVSVAGSALASLLLVVMTFLDFVLTFVGPFLFFWGASRIFAGGSARFQALVARLGRRILGELAQVASKNVYRNPARVAAITFLLTLISGYGVWVTGQFASIQNHSERQVFVSVGADISVTTSNASSSIALASQLSTWSNVSAATAEIWLTYSYSSQIRAIDPSTWRDAAYHEPEWFSGQSEDAIFTSLETDSHTIILEKGVASRLGLTMGDAYTVSMSSGVAYSMRVVGFFGPDTTQAQGFGGPAIPGFFGGWSYVPIQFWQSLPGTPFSSSRVLVNARENANAVGLEFSIRGLSFEYYTRSAEGELKLQSSVVGGDIFQGVLDVFRLGTVFAGLAASVGVGTVTYTSFREREKETTIMAVRGVSYRQLLGVLLMESLPIVVFSLALGTVVGLINIRGNALALNSIFLGQSFEAGLTPYRLVFSSWVLIILAVVFGSIVAAVTLPALLEARKTSEKMTRVVRVG